MKVTGLLLITLGLVAFGHAHVHAHQDYHLQCTREELGIRWPSYKSNSEYYVCHRLGDRPMIVNCNAGEVFTFVLQVCTSPSKYIPAPNLNVLPTSSPIVALPWNGHGVFKPLDVIHGGHPPLLGANQGHHNVHEIPHPPMVAVDPPKPPTVTVMDPNHEVIDKNTEEVEKPQHPAKPQKPIARPPMPPTPAPTPPVVDNAEDTKKPHAPLGKKPTPQKKTPSKKTPSKKTPPKPSKGGEKPKPTNTKAGKKSPKKSPKKPVTPVKKAPKAPTKA